MRCALVGQCGGSTFKFQGVKRSTNLGFARALKGKQRQRFGDMGLIELRKTNNFQPQSHF